MRRDLFMHDVGRAVFLHQFPSSSRFCKTPSGDNPAGEMPQKWHLTIAIDYPASGGPQTRRRVQSQAFSSRWCGVGAAEAAI